MHQYPSGNHGGKIIHWNKASTNIIEKNKDKINLKVYPNPASQEVNISIAGQVIDEVNIRALTGQQLMNVGSVSNTIDISGLKAGMYIVEVTIENTKLRQKLLVQR